MSKQDSFSSLFKKLRKDSGLSLEKLSERTKIQKRYLECLEKGEFERLPPDVYVRGFIIKCCTFFDSSGLSALLRFYIQQTPQPYGQASLARGTLTASPSAIGNSITPRHLAIAATALFLFLVGGYFLVRFIPFFFTPEISLIYPSKETLVVNFLNITVQGRTKYTSSLTFNGKELYIGKKGLFEGELELEEGVNILTLEAESRFGRKAEVVRRVVYIRN